MNGASLVNTGASNSSRHQDAIGNYGFGYNIVDDGHGASNCRHEVGDAHGNKQGSYSLHDIDGRARTVDYVADGHGFRAVVNTNEPGTAHSAPAAAIVASPYAAPVAPVVADEVPVDVVAPIAYAAPVTYGASIAHAASLAHGAVSNTVLLGVAQIAHNDIYAGHGLAHGAILIAGHLGYNGIIAGRGIAQGNAGLAHGLIH